MEQSKQEAMDELLQLSEIQKELNEAGTITQEAESCSYYLKLNFISVECHL